MSRTITLPRPSCADGAARLEALVRSTTERPSPPTAVEYVLPFASVPSGSCDTRTVGCAVLSARSWRNTCEVQFMSNQTMSGEMELNVTYRPSSDRSDESQDTPQAEG